MPPAFRKIEAAGIHIRKPVGFAEIREQALETLPVVCKPRRRRQSRARADHDRVSSLQRARSRAVCAEKRSVDGVVGFSENIENHLDSAARPRPICLHGPYGHLRRPLAREPVFACGDAAEREVFQPFLVRKRQAGVVAGGKRRLIRRRRPPTDLRSDRVQHAFCRKVKGRRPFGAADFLLIPCARISAAQASRSCTPANVWTALSTHPWLGQKQPSRRLLAAFTIASHRSVVRSPARGTAPADRAQAGGVGDTPAPQLLLQIRVLHPQKRLSDRRRRAQIQQRAKQKPLSVRIGRQRRRAGGRPFPQQRRKQKSAFSHPASCPYTSLPPRQAPSQA